MLFHCGQRFAEPDSQLSSHLAQRAKDVLFLGRLRLLFGEHVPVPAVLCAQTQNVLASKACDGAFQNRGASGPLTDVSGDSRSQACIHGPAHQRQHALDLPVCQQAQKRRLLQLDRQTLTQGVVEHRIAGLIHEVGKHNGVLIRELHGGTARQFDIGVSCCDEHKDRSSGNNQPSSLA